MELRRDDRVNTEQNGIPDLGPGAGGLSARAVAALLGLHERTISRAIQEGRLVASKRGRTYVITPEAIHHYRAALSRQHRAKSAPPRPSLTLLPRRGSGDKEQAAPTVTFGQSTARRFPRLLTSFVGREREIAAITELVTGETRLLTLTGPGGVGKTRLAIAVAMNSAAQFTDGAVFVPLAPVSDPALVLPTIARALDIRDAPGRPLAETLAAALHDRRMLLVLDNFEHVLDAAAEVASLLEACPTLTALVTSRIPLRLGVEQRFLAPPLALPAPGDTPAHDDLAGYEAVALFLERARSVKQDFSLDADNAAPVVAICRRLDGLPLAIELAAAWVRVLPPGALLERLEQRLPLLHGGPDDQPGRLRTMRNAIAWSYDLLSSDEARFFRRLGIFVGGFTLEAAEAVAAASSSPITHYPSPSVLDILASLIDKSLLQAVHANAWEPRFLMLETVREFALERLAQSGEAEDIASAHAAAMRDLAERAEPHSAGPEERQWRARLDAELGNVRAALTWALEHDVETALRIGAALWIQWSWNLVPEGIRWLGAALDRATEEPVLVRARALTTHGALAILAGDVASGRASAVPAISLANAAGDPIAEGLARWIAACSYIYDSSLAPVVAELDRALVLLAPAASAKVRTQAAYARWIRAIVSFVLGERDEAVFLYEEALAQVRDAESHAVAMIILSDFAGCLVDLGNRARARGLLHDALQLAADYGESHQEVVPLSTMALIDALDGDAVSAARELGAVEAVFTRTGMVMPAHAQHRLDRATELAKRTLGVDAFASSWDAGRADPAAVLAETLDRLDAIGTAQGAESAPYRLTPRERDVLRLLVAGQADKEIAAALAISRATVSRHVAAIRTKLDAPSRGAAIAIAVRDRLL